jgi:RHS repeat-associated protein
MMTNLGTTTTYFVGAHYEVTNGVVTKYYFAGSQRIAMRTNGTLNYLLGDHLGSTSLTTDASGNVISELRYKAWGETRYASGSMPAKYQYTGQYSYVSDFSLHFYNARWYDSSLSRFAQADTIVPGVGNPEAYDRYSYTDNNPVRYTDPSGHCKLDAQGNIIKTDCTVDDFKALSWEERLQWVESYVRENKLGDWHNDMEFAIKFMSEDPIHSQSGSAAFFMDAAVLQSMNDGMNIASGRPCVSHCDESQLWDDFYKAQAIRGPIKPSDQTLIDVRLKAEQGGVNLAMALTIQRGLYDPHSARYDDIYFGVFLGSANLYRDSALWINEHYPGVFPQIFDPRQSGPALYNAGRTLNKPIADVIFYQLNMRDIRHPLAY